MLSSKEPKDPPPPDIAIIYVYTMSDMTNSTTMDAFRSATTRDNSAGHGGCGGRGRRGNQLDRNGRLDKIMYLREKLKKWHLLELVVKRVAIFSHFRRSCMNISYDILSNQAISLTL